MSLTNTQEIPQLPISTPFLVACFSCCLETAPLWPVTHLGAGMAVAMLLTERTEGRHQYQQGAAGPGVPTVGPTLTQVACGTGQAPAAALVCQAAQAGGVGGAGRRAVGLQEEEGDFLREEA